jgi:hypothetical protein
VAENQPIIPGWTSIDVAQAVALPCELNGFPVVLNKLEEGSEMTLGIHLAISEVFLETIIPSRAATKKYLGGPQWRD